MMNIVSRYLAHSLRRSKGRGRGWPKRAGTLGSPCCGLETVAYASATLGRDPQRELAARCLGGRTAPGRVRAPSAQAWPGHPWLRPGEQEGGRRREAGGQRSPCPEGLRPPLGERRAPRATSALPTEHPWGARRVAGGEAGLEAAPGGHLQAPSKPLARVPTTQSEAREESRKQTIGEQAAGKRGEPAGVGSPGLGGRGDLAGQRQELERPGGAGSRGNQGEGTARSCVADVHGDTSRRISWSQGDRCSFVSPTFSL